MTTADLLDQIFRILNEAILLIFTAIGLYVANLIRKWVGGNLPVPPHTHTVVINEDKARRP